MKLLVGLFLLYLAYRVVRRLFSQKDVSKRPEPTFRHDILNADESAPTPSSRSRKKPTQWYGKDRRVTVQGYDIPGGLIYVGERLPDIHGYGDDACLINPRLKVSPAEPWEAGDEMDYWPRYATIPAKCRGAYLKWPATDGPNLKPISDMSFCSSMVSNVDYSSTVNGKASPTVSGGKLSTK